MNAFFLDTNVLVYHLLQNHVHYSPRSSRLIDRLCMGPDVAWCSSTVILETTFVLEKGFRVPRSDAYDPIREIVGIPAITFERRDAILDALEFWRDNPPLSYADCFHLVLTKQFGLQHICTFDKGMDRYPGITRIEPS